MLRQKLLCEAVELMSHHEKEEVIYALRQRVLILENENSSLQSLANNIEYAYDRMKTLYEQQVKVSEKLREESIVLANEVHYQKYQIQEAVIFEPFSDEIMTPALCDANNTTSNLQSRADSLNPFANIKLVQEEYIKPSSLEQQQSIDPSKLRVVPQPRKMSTSLLPVIPSSSPLVNSTIERKKIIESSEPELQHIEHIYFDKMNDSNESNMATTMSSIGELLFQNFLVIGPAMDEINGTRSVGEGGINRDQTSNIAGGSGSDEYLNNNYNHRGDVNTSQLSSNSAAVQGSLFDHLSEDVTLSQDILVELCHNQVDESQREVLSKHAFPFNVRCKKYRVKRYESFMTDIYKNLFKESKVKDLKQFVFTMEGEQMFLPKHAQKQKVSHVIEGSNPNKRQYCVYFQWDDYVFSKKEKGLLFKSPFVFCFVTYYPFFTFFREVIQHVISRIQKERIPLFNLHTKITSSQFLALDATWILKELQKETSVYARKLLDLRQATPHIHRIISFALEDDENLDSSPSVHQYELNSDQYESERVSEDEIESKVIKGGPSRSPHSTKVSFMVPSYKQLRLLETSEHSGSQLILQLLTFEDFWFILSLVMLEQQIVFFSSNILYIASALQTFSSLFKPFNKSMLVLHIFEGRLTLLETPPPFIGAINQGNQFIFNNRIIGQDSERVNFIDLDSRRVFLSDETLQLFHNQSAFMNYPRYSYEMRKTFSILTHSQYNAQQNFEFNDHQSKKQYNHLVFRSPPVPIQSLTQQLHHPLKSTSYNDLFSNLRATGKSENKRKMVQSFNHIGKSTNYENDSVLNAVGNVNINAQITLQDSKNEIAIKIFEAQQLQYSAFVKDMKVRAIEEIFDLLELTFKYYILDQLPRERIPQPLGSSSKPMQQPAQIAEVLDKILKRSEEKKFTGLFLHTQNFQYFFQQYYDTIPIAKPQTASTAASNQETFNLKC